MKRVANCLPFLFLIIANSLHAERLIDERLPMVSLSPTLEECNRLDSAIGIQLRAIYQADMNCYDVNDIEIRIVDGWCSGLPPYELKRHLTAYPHCMQHNERKCDLLKRRYIADVPDCRSRVQRSADSTSKNAQSLKSANDLYDDLMQKYNEAMSFALDPRAYFSRHLGDATYRQLFPGGVFEPPNSQYGTATEILRYSVNQACVGFQLTPNPIIRAFQEEALNQFSRILAQSLAEAERARGLMEAFDSKGNNFLASPSSVRNADQGKNPELECEIFEDVSASRSLQNIDRSLWLDLFQKCSQ